MLAVPANGKSKAIETMVEKASIQDLMGMIEAVVSDQVPNADSKPIL